MWMCVSDSSVAISQLAPYFAPPIENAVLNLSVIGADLVLPSASMQEGIWT